MLVKHLFLLFPLLAFAADTKQQPSENLPAENQDQASSQQLDLTDDQDDGDDDQDDDSTFTRIVKKVKGDDDDDDDEDQDNDSESKPRRKQRRRRKAKAKVADDDDDDDQVDEGTKARRKVRQLREIPGTALFVEWAFNLDNYRELCKAKANLQADDALKRAAMAFALPIQSYRDAQASGDVTQMRRAYLALIRLVMSTRPTAQRVQDKAWERSKINENIFRRAEIDDAMDARARFYSLLQDEDGNVNKRKRRSFRNRESRRLREIRKQARDLPDEEWAKLIHPECDLNRFVKRYVFLVRRAVCVSGTVVKPVRRYLAMMLKDNFDSPTMVRDLRKRARNRTTNAFRDSVSGFADFWTKRGDAAPLATGLSILLGITASAALLAFL